jgi:2-isopropylmalate synthase
MPDREVSDLIHDWNTTETERQPREIGLMDETLRDGLQSPSVRQPKIGDKLRLLHLMAQLGINEVNIGIPATGERFLREAAILAREVFQQKLPLSCLCGARILQADVEPIVNLSQQAGGPIVAGLFVGSSPIRRYTENWRVADLVQRVRQAVNFAKDHNLPVMFITEDTTRTDPDTLRQLYTAAIECGAEIVVISDTVGHATPKGAERLVHFMREIAGPDITIDWHGHRDRGMATACAIAAVEAGADRIQATALGIGERSGNTPMEQVLINLQLLGYIERDLTSLPEYCSLVAQACKVPLPINQPVVGEDAFRTATGVHAAAVIKALEADDHWLADQVYSSVPAAIIGRTQKIEIGPMSGSSNVRYVLRQIGVEPTDELVWHILKVTKSSDHVMSEVELLRTVVGLLSSYVQNTTQGRNLMNDPQTEKQGKIIEYLLDAINSLAATVEAGSGFDYAIYQYTQQADNELARAFENVLQEVQSGVRRREALRNMAKHINVPEVTTFVNTVIQADEQGISILETLKQQADQLSKQP